MRNHNTSPDIFGTTCTFPVWTPSEACEGHAFHTNLVQSFHLPGISSWGISRTGNLRLLKALTVLSHPKPAPCTTHADQQSSTSNSTTELAWFLRNLLKAVKPWVKLIILKDDLQPHFLPLITMATTSADLKISRPRRGSSGASFLERSLHAPIPLLFDEDIIVGKTAAQEATMVMSRVTHHQPKPRTQRPTDTNHSTHKTEDRVASVTRKSFPKSQDYRRNFPKLGPKSQGFPNRIPGYISRFHRQKKVKTGLP